MKKFLLVLLKYSLATIVLVNIICFFANYQLKKGMFYKPSFLINQFKSNTPFDYILLGSSRALTTLDSKQIDHQLNIKGINLAMDDTDLKTHFLMLQHFINNGYTTKYCILNIDSQSFTNTPKELGNNDYRFIPFTHQKHVKKHYLAYENKLLKPLYQSFINPFLAYGYYNLELLPAALISTIKPTYKNRFDNFGNYSYPTTNSPLKSSTISKTTKSITNPLLQEFIAFATLHNMKVILYIAPIFNTSIEITNLKNTHLINHSDAVQNPNLFYDNIHVNKKGRTKVTSIFIDDLKKSTNF